VAGGRLWVSQSQQTGRMRHFTFPQQPGHNPESLRSPVRSSLLGASTPLALGPPSPVAGDVRVMARSRVGPCFDLYLPGGEYGGAIPPPPGRRTGFLRRAHKGASVIPLAGSSEEARVSGRSLQGPASGRNSSGRKEARDVMAYVSAPMGRASRSRSRRRRPLQLSRRPRPLRRRPEPRGAGA